MTAIRRALVMLALMLTVVISAQEATTTKPAEEVTATAEEATKTAEGPLPTSRNSAYEVRSELRQLVHSNSDGLAQVLALDPGLLANEEFLAGYPEVADFVARHPEVAARPRFFAADFAPPQRHSSVLDEFLEGLAIFATFTLIAVALSWFIRTLVEQRRWNRLSRTQSEVHNKILDRFSSSEELLAYIRTPAGTKFLESAPIPLHASHPAPANPFARVIWSLQIGVVIAAGALGMMLISGTFADEAGRELLALGVVGFSIGIGFILSAVISVLMTRRLETWRAENPTPPAAYESTES